MEDVELIPVFKVMIYIASKSRGTTSRSNGDIQHMSK